MDRVFLIRAFEVKLLGHGCVISDVTVFYIPHHDGWTLSLSSFVHELRCSTSLSVSCCACSCINLSNWPIWADLWPSFCCPVLSSVRRCSTSVGSKASHIRLILLGNGQICRCLRLSLLNHLNIICTISTHSDCHWFLLFCWERDSSFLCSCSLSSSFYWLCAELCKLI